MYEICVKKTAQGERVLGLAETMRIDPEERVLGYARAEKTDKTRYYCRDKSLILSPGDVVFVNGIEGGGGWVEIVEFTRDEGDKDAADRAGAQGVPLYNQGVGLYGENRYSEAIDAFNACYRAGFFPKQAAYAASLCQQALGVDVTVPQEFADQTDRVGTAFIAANLACKLIQDGHRAAQPGESSVLAVVDGATYDIRVASLFGSFMLNAWRKEGDRTIPLTDSGLNPRPTAADQRVISLVQEAASLPPQPLPAGGLPDALA